MVQKVFLGRKPGHFKTHLIRFPFLNYNSVTTVTQFPKTAILYVLYSFLIVYSGSLSDTNDSNMTQSGNLKLNFKI